jgi:hypothetical protein
MVVNNTCPVKNIKLLFNILGLQAKAIKQMGSLQEVTIHVT